MHHCVSKRLTTLLFPQQHVTVNNMGSIFVPHCWPFWKRIPSVVDGFSDKGPVIRRMFPFDDGIMIKIPWQILNPAAILLCCLFNKSEHLCRVNIFLRLPCFGITLTISIKIYVAKVTATSITFMSVFVSFKKEEDHFCKSSVCTQFAGFFLKLKQHQPYGAVISFNPAWCEATYWPPTIGNAHSLEI